MERAHVNIICDHVLLRAGGADLRGKPGGNLHGVEQAAGGLTQLTHPGREGEDHYCLRYGGSWEVGKEDCKKHVALDVVVGQGIILECRRTS